MRQLRLPVAIAFVAAAAAFAFARPESTEPKHLRAARSLLQSLQPDDTSYRHKDGVVRWKGDDGPAVCHTDCSGFLDAVLMHSYGFDRKDFEKWLGAARPTAINYHDSIGKGRGFTRVGQLRDAQPGDILAVKYPPGSSNTGHVMLVSASPKRIKSSQPLAEGTEQWEVAVIDCSHSGHGTSDTRHLDGGKSRAGLGQGVLRVYTNSNGAIAGYTWSTYSKSEYNDQRVHHTEIGRLDPAFKPRAKTDGGV